MSTIVLLASGGIKSAVAAARVADDHHLILAHVNYGQPPAAAQARAIRQLLGGYPNAQYVELLMPHLLEFQEAHDHPNASGGASGKSGKAAAGSQRAPSGTRFEPLAPVSLRGLWMMLCAVGAQTALRFGATEVVTGLTAGGPSAHLGLPVAGTSGEVRRDFLHALNIAYEVLSPKGQPVRITAPLMGLSYGEIVKLADHLAVPFKQTWTCEHVGPKPCGGCETCKARNDAFELTMIVDPLRARPARVG